MEVFRLTVGPLETNCYLVYDGEAREGIVIDPGDEGAQIVAEIEKRRLRIVCIVNTHGHWDHTDANEVVASAAGAPVWIHWADAPYLTDPTLRSAMFTPPTLSLRPADGLLEEGDTVTFGACQLTVLHTPGHTPGGLCLYGQSTLFSGDTLFQRSIGRSDLPGGDGAQLLASIRQKLLPLPAATVVCPGHGGVTTIGEEKRENYFLK